MIDRLKHYRGLCIFTGIVVILVLWGCGRKGPPVPPHKFVPPAAKSLKYKIDDGALTLTWKIPVIRETDRKKLAGCTVFRSKKPLAEAPCADCPPDFERIIDIPVQLDVKEDTEPREISYFESLEKGYLYAYRVILYSHKGISSKDSRFVNFEY